MAAVEQRTSWAQTEGSVLGLALFRIVVGLMALRYVAGFARDYVAGGFYGNYFFLPYTTWIPQPDEATYLGLLIAAALGAALMIIGWQTRFAAIVTFVLIAYHFSLNEIWHRHNRYFLVLCLFLLCLGPSGRALSFDAKRLKLPPVGPLWTGFLIKMQMTLIYLASAFSMALDPAWRSGDVLDGRGLQFIWVRWMPEFVLNIVPPEKAVQLLTTQALVTEFLLAILLWFKGTRRLAIWCGILFHAYIEVQYSVITFSYLALATYFIFADLKCGEKTWVYSSRSEFSARVARLISRLDWLFQIRLEAYAGTKQRFVDRNGTPYGGTMGWVMLGANLPIFYPICYPLSWLRFLRLGRCRFSIISAPSEPTRGSAGSWITWWALLYLLFLIPIRVPGVWDSTSDAMRFWDLPWFFALMCFVASVYRHTMLRNLPARVSIADAKETPMLEPSPATR